jgi:hypothetical protein
MSMRVPLTKAGSIRSPRWLPQAAGTAGSSWHQPEASCPTSASPCQVGQKVTLTTGPGASRGSQIWRIP